MATNTPLDPIPLSRPYPAREGVPVITEIDPRIHTARYFGACMSCAFCNDACCRHGVDVDGATASRILARAAELEPVVGSSRESWFEDAQPDEDLPGGTVRRTRVVGGGCVFLNPAGRGCLLHAFALERGEDYHDLKPMISALFPLTFEGNSLTISEELDEGTLVCGGDGPTAFQAARLEVAYYFGEQCAEEIERLGSPNKTPRRLTQASATT